MSGSEPSVRHFRFDEGARVVAVSHGPATVARVLGEDEDALFAEIERALAR